MLLPLFLAIGSVGEGVCPPRCCSTGPPHTHTQHTMHTHTHTFHYSLSLSLSLSLPLSLCCTVLIHVLLPYFSFLSLFSFFKTLVGTCTRHTHTHTHACTHTHSHSLTPSLTNSFNESLHACIAYIHTHPTMFSRPFSPLLSLSLSLSLFFHVDFYHF